MLEAALLTPDVVSYQIRNYLIQKAPALPKPASAAAWTADGAKQIREKFLREVVFHGWPAEWVNAPLKVEDLGLIPAGPGYRMRKLRYEIVPGFYSVGILYEPEKMAGKVPGHSQRERARGRAGQRASNTSRSAASHQARTAFCDLNLEWISLRRTERTKESSTGSARTWIWPAPTTWALFYLAMRKGLDYLYQHPNTDRARLGVTGLCPAAAGRPSCSARWTNASRWRCPWPGTRPSPSGWSAFTRWATSSKTPRYLLYADYPHLTAMRAPRPTLLVYNARRRLLLPRSAGEAGRLRRRGTRSSSSTARPENLGWHMNTDPSDHNYQLDNRLAAYRFIGKHFGIAGMDVEEQLGSEIKSYDELMVGIPKDNLTMLGLARKLALRISRPAIPPAGAAREAWSVKERARLARVLRYKAGRHGAAVEARQYAQQGIGDALLPLGLFERFERHGGVVPGALDTPVPLRQPSYSTKTARKPPRGRLGARESRRTGAWPWIRFSTGRPLPPSHGPWCIPR